MDVAVCIVMPAADLGFGVTSRGPGTTPYICMHASPLLELFFAYVTGRNRQSKSKKFTDHNDLPLLNPMRSIRIGTWHLGSGIGDSY